MHMIIHVDVHFFTYMYVPQPPFESKLRALARSTINTRRNGGVYRNVLMYGPPGTGKTMFAKVKQHCTCLFMSTLYMYLHMY